MIDSALYVHGRKLITESEDGLNHDLIEDKYLTAMDSDRSKGVNGFRQFRMLGKRVTKSDGASMPTIAQIIGKLIGTSFDHYGEYWSDAFAHDAAFRKVLEELIDGQWVNANLSEDEANHLIKALMFASTPNVKAEIIFEALQLFGKKAYDEDAKAWGALEPGINCPIDVR